MLFLSSAEGASYAMTSPQKQPAEDADEFIVDDGGDIGNSVFSAISIETPANDTIHVSAVRVPARKK